jgi:hypothetical protein
MQLYKCFLQNEKVTDANSLRDNKWLLWKAISSSAALAFIKTIGVNYGENYFTIYNFTFDKCIVVTLPPPFFISILLKCSALSVKCVV